MKPRTSPGRPANGWSEQLAGWVALTLNPPQVHYLISGKMMLLLSGDCLVWFSTDLSDKYRYRGLMHMYKGRMRHIWHGGLFSFKGLSLTEEHVCKSRRSLRQKAQCERHDSHGRNCQVGVDHDAMNAPEHNYKAMPCPDCLGQRKLP